MALFYRFLILIALFASCCVSAQQPSYQRVGAEALEGKDVYTLLDDSKGVLWVGTDDGVYAYDGTDFKHYSNSKLKNNSAFSLRRDSQDRIYYCNFAGQVVRIQNDSVEIFYELPDSLIARGISMEIDANSAIIILSKSLMKIDQQGQLEILYATNDNLPGTIGRQPDGRISAVFGRERILAHWDGTELELELCQGINNYSETELYGYRYNNKRAILIDHSGRNIIQGKVNKWQVDTFHIPAKYSHQKQCLSMDLTNNGYHWCSCLDKGAYRYQLSSKKIDTHRLLPDFYISSFLEDQVGDLWLGTFKDGLLRIPHEEILDFRNHPVLGGWSTVALTAGGGDTLFAATEKGHLYFIDEQNRVTLLAKVDKYFQFSMEYVPSAQRLYMDDSYYDLKSKTIKKIRTASIKEMQVVPPNTILLADFAGLAPLSTNKQEASMCSELKEYKSLIDTTQRKNNQVMLGLGRINTFHYQARYNRFWIGNNDMLRVLQDGQPTIKLRAQENIVSVSITSWGDTTCVATKDELLLFVDTTYVETLELRNAPLLGKIRAIKRKGAYLYIASGEGLQRIDLRHRTVQTLGLADGLFSSKVMDIALLEEYCYVLTSKGVQKLPYQVFEQDHTPIRTYIDEVFVNGEIIPITAGVQELKYNENELEVLFKVVYLQNRDKLRCRYRLLGADSSWITIPSTAPSRIYYNALNAGAYTLEIQALAQKSYNAPITRYAFHIYPPFWETWWFISLSVLALVILVSMFFIIRIRIINQQNQLLLEKQLMEKRLVESQQSALRAQMNPHFLFNALNSIQEMIIVNDKYAASIHLGKFADLMRLYLHHSQEKCISLAEELQALRLYLELEEVRFEDNLTVTLEVDDNLSLEELTLPPMLLQPYVENSFKHGLLHKISDRRLNIHFFLEGAKQQFCCTIRDNGVGREASAKIKQAQYKKHTSFASSATLRRLKLLNYNKKKYITACTKDLKGSGDDALGTEVVVCIPFGWEELSE